MSRTLSTFILLISNCLTFRTPNIGTTIFIESDLTKQCWDVDGIFLLHSRMFLELLLPSPRVLHELDNEFAGDLIKYFSLILTTMHALPESRKKQLSLYAMEDIIGGYFHSIILPVARMSYYAGIISWKSMRKLDRYYEQLKDLLRTEGQGWASPRIQRWENYEARRLPLHQPSCKQGDVPCGDLRIYRRTETCDDSKGCGSYMAVTVPIPFFDCKIKPYAVAVPFRTVPLFDLCADRSSYVIIRYFIQSNRCLYCKCKNGYCSVSFRNNLYTWLLEEVVPRLNDARTYAAFGGVIRLIRTLQEQGVSHVDLLHERDCYNRMAGIIEDQFVEYTRHKLKVILIALLVVLLLWFLLACCILCCRMTRKKCSCGKPPRRETRKTVVQPEKYSSGANKILHDEKGRREKFCRCSKTYFSFTDDSSPYKTSSNQSGSSRKSSSPRTIFSSTSQSRTSRADIQSYSAVVEPVSMTKGGSSSSESRGLPPIEEISERSSLVDSKRPSAYRKPAAVISASDSEKEQSFYEKQELSNINADRLRRSHLVHNIQSGKLDSLQEDSRVHCYSDESDMATEETESKTDISSDSIENLSVL